MNNLEKKVLQFIGENIDSPDVFGDITPIRDSINDAIEEITLLTGSYKENYTIPLYQGQGIYQIEFSRGQFAYVTDVFIRNNNQRLEQTDLIKLNRTNPQWLRDCGVPYEYFHVGMDFIGVHPAPSGTSGILSLECVCIPERYTQDNDRITLRKQFEKTVIHYAVGEYYASRGDATSAMEHMAIYFDLLGLNQSYPESAETYYRINRESQ